MRHCLLIGGTLDKEHGNASLFAQGLRQRPEPYCPEGFLCRDYRCQPLQAEGNQVLLIQRSGERDALLVEDTGSYRLPPRKDHFPYYAKRPCNPFSMSHLSKKCKGIFERYHAGQFLRAITKGGLLQIGQPDVGLGSLDSKSNPASVVGEAKRKNVTTRTGREYLMLPLGLTVDEIDFAVVKE